MAVVFCFGSLTKERANYCNMIVFSILEAQSICWQEEKNYLSTEILHRKICVRKLNQQWSFATFDQRECCWTCPNRPNLGDSPGWFSSQLPSGWWAHQVEAFNNEQLFSSIKLLTLTDGKWLLWVSQNTLLGIFRKRSKIRVHFNSCSVFL